MELNQNLCYMHNRAVFPKGSPNLDSSKMSRFQASRNQIKTCVIRIIEPFSRNVLRFTIQAKLAVFELLLWNPIKTYVICIIEPFSQNVLRITIQAK